MATLDPWARLLFIAMWNWADDSGRGTADPRTLAGFAFPNDEHITSADIRRMLGGIRRAFGVVFYEVEGRPYYYIPSWEKHQKIDKRSLPKHPDPAAGIPWNPDPDDDTFPGAEQAKRPPSEEPPGTSGEPAEDPPSLPVALDAGSRNRGTGEVGTEKDMSTPKTARTRAGGKSTDYDSDPKFLELWDVYPRKDGKAPAFGAFQKAVKTTDPDVIIAGAKRYADAERRKGTPTEKIKMAQGWLNDRRWEDAPAPAEPARPNHANGWGRPPQQNQPPGALAAAWKAHTA